MSGSDFVHAHDTVVVTAPKPPARFRAVTITLAVTRRCPGCRTIRLTRGGDVRRRWALPREALCLPKQQGANCGERALIVEAVPRERKEAWCQWRQLVAKGPGRLSMLV